MIKHSTQVRVRYAETDQMRMVHHTRYFEYFEQARSELLRSIGMSYSEIEKSGTYLPVIEAFARYRKSAKYDELITVETVVEEMPVARIRLNYRIFREGEQEPMVEGYTVHSFLSAATGKPTRAPAQFLQLLQEAFQ